MLMYYSLLIEKCISILNKMLAGSYIISSFLSLVYKAGTFDVVHKLAGTKLSGVCLGGNSFIGFFINVCPVSKEVQQL